MKRPAFALPFRRLSRNVFLLITLFLLVPVYTGFIILKRSYERYIRREVTGQIVAAIQKGEAEFRDTFEKMAVISNVFTTDKQLVALLNDDDSSYWDRNKRFDELTATLFTNNLFNLDGIRITMIDRHKRNYANWGLYFNDYSFLLDEDWVRESLKYKGHIAWNLFAPSFVIGEKEQYISLARSTLYPLSTGEYLATIIISINEKFINTLLRRNDPDADFIRVCTTGAVEDIFAVNNIRPEGNDDLGALFEKARKSGTNSLLCSVDGKPYLMGFHFLSSPWMPNSQRLAVLYFSGYTRIAERLNALSLSINIGVVLFLVLLFAITVIISATITKPVRLLSGMVSVYTKTQKIAPFPMRRRDEIGELGNAFVDMETRINELFDKLKEESEIREQYRFSALRAQINPHFLFNTLNTIRWMALIRKADNIVDTINALSRILDYSMGRSGELAPLREELEMIESYAHIQNYRYGEDMEVRVNIEEGLLEQGIVKFILQPAVENSFIHAFKKIKGKKRIIIEGKQQKQKLKLYVRDNGSGMTHAKLSKLRESLDEKSQNSRNTIGLYNVHQRIRSGFGEGYGIRVESAPGEGTTVEYILPLLNASDAISPAAGGANAEPDIV